MAFAFGYETYLNNEPTQEKIEKMLAEISKKFDLILVADHLEESLGIYALYWKRVFQNISHVFRPLLSAYALGSARLKNITPKIKRAGGYLIFKNPRKFNEILENSKYNLPC